MLDVKKLETSVLLVGMGNGAAAIRIWQFLKTLKKKKRITI